MASSSDRCCSTIDIFFLSVSVAQVGLAQRELGAVSHQLLVALSSLFHGAWDQLENTFATQEAYYYQSIPLHFPADRDSNGSKRLI